MTTAPEKPRGRIDPRIRDRRIEVTREAGRRRLRVLLVVSCVLSTVGLAFLAVTSPLFDIDHVRVAGVHEVSVDQVRAASGVKPRDHLLFLDTGAVARRIERLPWVQHATVKRDLPGTLDIAVSEYVPAAYVRVPDGVVLLAANGHAIAHARSAPAGAVEVRGVRRPPAAGSTLAPPDAAGVVGRLPSALASRVVAVDVTGPGLALLLAGGGQVRLGDTDRLDAKATSALAVLAHLGAAPFSYIDVSTPDRPVSHA